LELASVDKQRKELWPKKISWQIYFLALHKICVRLSRNYLREELQGTLSCGYYYIIATGVFLVAIIFLLKIIARG
jgi:hypothetical protein